MGKSGKKIKSDRINALRKQYDLFLEEDKKRRDRNEYILGQLEKMRLSTVLQPVRYKEESLFNDSIYSSPRRLDYLNQVTREEYDKNITTTQNALLKPTNVKKVGDNLILNEISKRYILIPKLQSSQNDTAYYEPANVNPISDTNWKNKYNILNELKKTEKEATSEENVYHAGINDDCKSNILIEEHQSKVNYDSSLIDEHKTNIPNHELRSNTTVVNNDTINKNKLREFDTKNNVHVPIANDDIDCIKKTIDIPNENITRQKEFNIINKELPDENTGIIETNERDFIDHSRKIKFHGESRNNDDLNKHYETQDHLHKNCNNNKPNENKQTKTNETILEKPSNNYKDEMDVKVRGVSKPDESSINNEIVRASTQVQETVENEQTCHDDETILGDTEYESNDKNFDYKQNSGEEVNNEHEEKQILYGEANEAYEYKNDNTLHHPIENENYTNQEYSYNESQQEPYTRENEIKHEGSTEDYDANYEQQYANNYIDPNLNQYQNQEYEVDTNNPYEQQQGEYTNVNYEGHPDNTNYEYINSENIEVTNHDQQNNVHSYENQGSHENMNHENQQYEVDYSYEQQQGEYTNMNYEGQPDNTNYDYVNTENIELTDENLHENVYNYENQEAHENEQHYDGNVQEEYAIPNEQDEYKEQQGNILIGPETEHNAEKQHVDDDYQENRGNHVKNNVEDVNDAEKK